jgi:DNA-binding CsgD family transcriptional regulator
MAEFNAGDLARAHEYAERAVQASRAAGDDDWLKVAYATYGMMHLHRGDPVAAVDVLGQGWEIEQRLGRFEPGTLLWHADYVEALVATGSRTKAAEVLQELRGQVQRLGRTVALLGLARAEAMLQAATGDPRDAAEALAATLERLGEHPYPMETARAWYALGTLERRAHRRGTARAALTEAAARYAAAGAVNWQTVVEADLARLHGGRGAGLSETERRIVELVRSGATNREVAKTLFLSVKAVEANLTRLYRRLGVRNRAQLADALESLDLMV